MLSYLVLLIAVFFINIICHLNLQMKMLDALLDQKISINYVEIFLSILVAGLIGIFGAIISNRKWVFRFFKKLKITRHYGDEDVWSYIHNSSDYEWVIVRDHKYELFYYCYIMLFSDYGEKRELLLGDVAVYSNKSGDFIYSTDKLYICRNEFDLSIEIIESQQKGDKNG